MTGEDKEITKVIYCPNCGEVPPSDFVARHCSKCGATLKEKVVVR